VGRLENIVARNRRPSRFQERVVVSTVIGGIILLIIALAVFTDLGLPPEAAREPRSPSAPAAPAAHPARSPDRAPHVDDVLLVRPRAVHK
jgi:uncharacterized SAM-binding protein YcdF (DUF218 family)